MCFLRHEDVTVPPLDDMPPFLPLHAGPTLTTVSRLGASMRLQFVETLSTIREVVLMPRDIGPVVPHEAVREDDVVVLVHGIFASAGVWRPMKRMLSEKTGAKVASFTHAPGVGIDRIARSLAELVERVPAGARVHLVGHSLGGLVVRWYVQELGGHARVTQTISLGSPFGGTNRAHPFPIFVGRELGHGSRLLARLRARAREHDVPHTSLIGAGDMVVVPRESAAFPHGEVVVLPHCGHNTLLFHEDSIAHVVERVQRVQTEAERARMG